MPKINGLKIIVLCLAFSWVGCVFCAYFYQIPQPLFGTQQSGGVSEALAMASYAWLFYGVFFGAIWLSAIVSYLSSRLLLHKLPIKAVSPFYVTYLPCMVTSLGWPILIACLHLFIGPW